MRPVSWFNDLQTVQNSQDTNTGSIVGDALTGTINDIKNLPGNIFSGAGVLLNNLLTGILNNPVVIFIIVAIILFVVFKDKIIK